MRRGDAYGRIPAWSCQALLGIGALALLVAVAGIHGPARVVLAVLFASTVPGGAVVAHRSPKDGAGAAALVVALSWAVTILVNDATAVIGWWHPTAVLVGIGAISGGSFVFRIGHDRRGATSAPSATRTAA